MATQQRGQLIYGCPFCHATIEIGAEMIERTVDCPSCNKPFRVEPPRAEVIATRNGDESQTQAEYSVSEPAEDEQDLRVVHPAMFRKHPLIFLGTATLGVGAIGGLIWSASSGGALVGSASAILLVAVLGYFGYWWLEILFTTLTVTNKRTILRKGILSRNTTEVQHDDVRNLQVDQKVLERFLGVGDVAVSSSGQDDLEIYAEAIPNPNSVAELIRSLQ